MTSPPAGTPGGTRRRASSAPRSTRSGRPRWPTPAWSGGRETSAASAWSPLRRCGTGPRSRTGLRSVNTGDPVAPSFAARIHVAARPVGAGIRVSVGLENQSSDPVVAVQGRGRSAGQTRHDESRDHFLFRAQLEVRADPGVITPIRMDLGPDAYRYSPDLPAYASNCGVRPIWDSGKLTGLETVAAPVHQTWRARPKNHDSTRFAALEDDPLPALRKLARDLRDYTSDPAWGTAGLDAALAARKETDRQAFAAEADRFADGIRWLERDPRLMLAFRLTNKTMQALAGRSRRPHQGWRLFQLVFLVSQLPALAWREHPEADFTPDLWGDPGSADPTEAVSVLWYPTAGGKTEAYLGPHGVLPVLRPRPRQGQRNQRLVPVPAAPAVPAADPAAARRRGNRRSDPQGRGDRTPAPRGRRQPRRPVPGRVLRRRREHPELARQRAASTSCAATRRHGAGTAWSTGARTADSRNVTVRPPDPEKLRLVIACDRLPRGAADRGHRPGDLPLPARRGGRNAGQARRDRPVRPVRIPARRRRLRLRAARLRTRRQVPRARPVAPRRAAAPAPRAAV